MLFRKNKKGSLGVSSLKNVILGLVMVSILFQVAAVMIPDAQDAGDTLNATGVPLGSLIAGGGIIFTIIMLGLFLVVFNHFMTKGKK